MVEESRLEGALHALQDLLVVARQMARDGADHKVLERFFDSIEILPGLMREKEDQTERFEEYLEFVAQEFPSASLALEHYRAG